jgi:hypothetical protein
MTMEGSKIRTGCHYCLERPVSGAEIRGVHICANCVAIWATTGAPDIGEEKDYGNCELCKDKAIGIANDFNMRTKKDVKWRLCKDHMVAVGRLNLDPRDVKRMWKKHGVTFLTHDDYYAEDGTACQPR